MEGLSCRKSGSSQLLTVSKSRFKSPPFYWSFAPKRYEGALDLIYLHLLPSLSSTSGEVRFPSRTMIRLGGHYRDEYDRWATDVSPEKFFIHPDFTKFRNDIALIKLSKKVIPDESRLNIPICRGHCAWSCCKRRLALAREITGLFPGQAHGQDSDGLPSQCYR